MEGFAADDRRALLRASLDPLLLAALVRGRRHGYALAKELSAAAGVPVSLATLYPRLHRLAAAGWVDAVEDTAAGRARKRYGLTPAGRDALRSVATQWQAQIARLQGVVLPGLRQAGPRR